jgi:hypothetical protein
MSVTVEKLSSGGMVDKRPHLNPLPQGEEDAIAPVRAGFQIENIGRDL